MRYIFDKPMEYRGYQAIITYDQESDTLVGRVDGINDVLSFDGQTLDELKNMFHETIDDYLEACARIEKEPERRNMDSIHAESAQSGPDIINHPAHYMSRTGLETIDVIESFTDPVGWNMGNVIKYICRWQKKNGLEDLKKAEFYLKRLIRMVEREESAKQAQQAHDAAQAACSSADYAIQKAVVTAAN